MKKDQNLNLEELLKESDLYDNPLTEKQKDIIRAAEELFVKQGFAETPTASIAKQANVTEKTLFKHFPSKEALFKRVLFPLMLRTIIPMQIKEVQKILQEDGKSYQEIVYNLAKNRLETLLRFHDKFRFVMAEMLRNNALRTQFCTLWFDNIWGEVTNLVTRFQKKGEVRKDINADAIARAQICLIAGYAATRTIFSTRKDWNDEKELQDLMRILMDGVGTKK